MLMGLVPWIVYWALLGNIPLLTAVLVALAVAVATLLGGRATGSPTLAAGSVAAFTMLAALAVLAPPASLARWVLPLSHASLVVLALTTMALGRPFLRDAVAAEQPVAVVQSELFDPLVTRLCWIWTAAFAAMTVSATVPAVIDGEATAPDARTPLHGPLSWGCSWVIPFVALATAVIASRLVAHRMTAGFGDAVRKTTFVAFVDMEIDQLYYLAQEHANREVGPGEEAYNVTVGTKGTPLLADDTRVSWPSTFKVRQRRA